MRYLLCRLDAGGRCDGRRRRGGIGRLAASGADPRLPTPGERALELGCVPSPVSTSLIVTGAIAVMSNDVAVVLRARLPNISASRLAGLGMSGSIAPAARWSADFSRWMTMPRSHRIARSRDAPPFPMTSRSYHAIRAGRWLPGLPWGGGNRRLYDPVSLISLPLPALMRLILAARVSEGRGGVGGRQSHVGVCRCAEASPR